MYVRNQTKTDMSVTPSQGSSQNVAPGGVAVFYGKAPGMGYDDLDDQWAYDVGTYIGACLAVRHQPEDQS